MEKFDVIYCDPPWQFNSKKTGGSMKSGASQLYDTMTLEELKEMPVGELAADNCMLIMWWVGAMGKEAFELAEAWGFKVRNMNGIVWVKQTVLGKPFFGMGYYTRAGSESCLIAIKGTVKPISRSVRAVFSSPVSGHSAKPSDVRDKILELIGYGRKIELFHRGVSKGNWFVFGNQSYPSLVLDEYGWREPHICELALQLEEIKNG